eukprot:SAG31_NODE_1296_length_8945_cov_6.341510_5_plen_96_part_00
MLHMLRPVAFEITWALRLSGCCASTVIELTRDQPIVSVGFRLMLNVEKTPRYDIYAGFLLIVRSQNATTAPTSSVSGRASYMIMPFRLFLVSLSC